ncbi:MAG: hypothetical protein IJ468_04700 [Lachnospiraceae bacterium]|nr:hypothetical protein [Lachnospiraceae bacterium]
MKKRMLTALLVAAMFLSPVLTACSDATENAEVTPDAATVSATPEEGAAEVVEEEPQDF